MKLLKKRYLYIIILALIALTVGCNGKSLDISQLHDDRALIGCVAVAADGKSKWISPVSGELCKVFCSEALPENFTYSYDRNGCKISISTGETDPVD